MSKSDPAPQAAQPQLLLEAYRSKRNFAITPEPDHEPEHSAATDARLPLFVVHKHWASSLHFDFRLELDGVLKSWAVPKGPSLDPLVKRMAVEVEDHPIAYADFEGTIPAGQYGAGEAVVWDSGQWTPTGDALAGYRAGNLKFELHGDKLRGKWVLVRIKGKGEKQPTWLLIKEKDAFVRPTAEFDVVKEEPKSAGQPRAAEKCALPATLSPQLALLAAVPPADTANWIHEIKFDGYRMLARVEGEKVQLFTRNGHDWSAKLLPLQRSLKNMKLLSGWYDGEIVVLGATGTPDFGALQRSFEAQATEDVVFYVFDLPFVDGQDLRAWPLHARRAWLERVLAERVTDRVRLSEAFSESSSSVLVSACKLGLEGVIAKRRDSVYSATRNGDWLKLKCGQRQEFVVGGYTDPKGSRTGFGALLLGVYDPQGALQYAGKVGSGFSETMRLAFVREVASSVRRASPFVSSSEIEGRPHWITPQWVAEVSFGEWTAGGHIRHAVFRGLRRDKEARSIVREAPQHPAASKAEATTPAKPAAKEADSAPPTAPHPSLDRMRVTHPDRVIDASTGASKMDLLCYYAQVTTLMMKHLKHRPVALLRAPEGVLGHLFFQRHAKSDQMAGIRDLDPAPSMEQAALIEVASAHGVLSAAQWNVIEFHTMNTVSSSKDSPDRLVFDLDPGAGVAWAQVQEAATLVRAFLDALGLPAFLKTSGGKGLHVVVPIRKGPDWDTTKGFSRAVVQHMAKTIPQRFVAKSGPKNRVGKIYIDYLRNGLGATTVCAWSVRARPGLGISVPVAWDELDGLSGGNHWCVGNAHARLDVGNTPWNGYARAARGLGGPMRALGYEAGM